MHFSFEAINAALTQAKFSWLSEWMDEEIFSNYKHPPAILGLSIMGPSQVFAALLVARKAKSKWPKTLIVAGGSHATLLHSDMLRDQRYLCDIDHVLPGHSEHDFVALLNAVYGLRSASDSSRTQLSTGGFDYLPLFNTQQLAQYDPGSLTLPLQFTRGCAYARCMSASASAVSVPGWIGMCQSEAFAVRVR